MSLRILLIAASLMLLSACASNKPMLKAEAFSEPVKFAVISAYGVVEGHSVNTDPAIAAIIDKLPEMTINTLNESRHASVISQDKVFASKAYQGITDLGRLVLHHNVDPYKRFDPKEETVALQTMAKELGVQGFIVAQVRYGAHTAGMNSGTTARGGVRVSAFSGQARGQVSYDIAAYDANGELFWKEMVSVLDTESTVIVMGAGKYRQVMKNFEPLTESAVKQAVGRLGSQLGS